MVRLSIIEKIAGIALNRPDAIAIKGVKSTLSYKDLIALVDQYSSYIKQNKHSGYAIDLGNGPEWAVLDLALLDANKVNIPIPNFFTDKQVQYLLTDGGVQTVFTDVPDKFNGAIDRSFNLCGRK